MNRLICKRYAILLSVERLVPVQVLENGSLAIYEWRSGFDVLLSRSVYIGGGPWDPWVRKSKVP